MKKRKIDMFRLGMIRGIYAHEDGAYGLSSAVGDISGCGGELASAYLEGFKRGFASRHAYLDGYIRGFPMGYDGRLALDDKARTLPKGCPVRSEEHTSELQSLRHLV